MKITKQFLAWVSDNYGPDIARECSESTENSKQTLNRVLSGRKQKEFESQKRGLEVVANSYVADDAIMYDMTVLDEPL